MQLIAELRAAMPDENALPSPEAASQAIQVAVYGGRPHVLVNAPQANNGSTASVSSPVAPQESVFWTRARRVGASIVGLATVAGAVFAFFALRIV